MWAMSGVVMGVEGTSSRLLAPEPGNAMGFSVAVAYVREAYALQDAIRDAMNVGLALRRTLKMVGTFIGLTR